MFGFATFCALTSSFSENFSCWRRDVLSGAFGSLWSRGLDLSLLLFRFCDKADKRWMRLFSCSFSLLGIAVDSGASEETYVGSTEAKQKEMRWRQSILYVPINICSSHYRGRVLCLLGICDFWETFGSHWASIWKTLCRISCDCRWSRLCIVFL